MSLLRLTVAAFALSGIGTFLITPATAKLARRLGLMDRPDASGRKSHVIPTPYLGGVAIIAGLAVGAILVAIVVRPATETIGSLAVGLLVALGLALVGFADDVRPLPRSLRLVAQILAAVAAWALGFSIEATGWPVGNFLMTLVWIVGITNAFNLLDNMDGLSAGMAGVSALSFALIAWAQDLFIVTIVSASIAGAALGFLGHNRHPAKIFMGDSGSLFLGYVLALIGIELKFAPYLFETTFLVPVVVLGVPIFDTTLVVLSRLRHRRPVFLGGRDHVSHRLVRLGLPVPAAVALLYWTGLCLGWLGFVISRSTVDVGWMLLAFVVAVGVFLGALLWRVPVYAEEPGRRPLPADAVDPDEIVKGLREASSS
ncbi:MAG: glycosyltransferase family 4 protein [Actinomycetota bacterium]